MKPLYSFLEDVRGRLSYRKRPTGGLSTQASGRTPAEMLWVQGPSTSKTARSKPPVVCRGAGVRLCIAVALPDDLRPPTHCACPFSCEVTGSGSVSLKSNVWTLMAVVIMPVQCTQFACWCEGCPFNLYLQPAPVFNAPNRERCSSASGVPRRQIVPGIVDYVPK